MTRKWTFMVYMAGDNGKLFSDAGQLMPDLQQAGWDDLAEMAGVGSTPDVTILAQYDTLDNQQYTPRFYLDQSSQQGQLIGRLSPINTGEPKNLTDFIVWGIKNYPAEKYALVLWNHGTGWKEDDIYARYRESLENQDQGDDFRSATQKSSVLKRSLFTSTAEKIMGVAEKDIRAICYDDTSMAYLDNAALANALQDAENMTNTRLDLLGMDACLMGMIEVAYQVRSFAKIMVASQEVEDADGWPYKDILEMLINSPKMDAEQLGHCIVNSFGLKYENQSSNRRRTDTLSAVRLGQISNIFDDIQALSLKVTDLIDTDIYIENVISRIRRNVAYFKDDDSVDLRHLFEILQASYAGSDQGIIPLANRIVKRLELNGPESIIVANYHGIDSPNANGLSIYFPARRYSPFYDKQEFINSGWNQLVRKVNNQKYPIIDLRTRDGSRNILPRQEELIITCPICGGQVAVDKNIGEIGSASGYRDIRTELQQFLILLQKALETSTAKANQWIDLPCPSCSHLFQFNSKSGETRR
jgi:hypothetical protein